MRRTGTGSRWAGRLQKQRAEHLVATAVSFLGITSLSVHHADACMKLSDANGDQQTAFDRAAALECLARSHAVRRIGRRGVAAGDGAAGR